MTGHRHRVALRRTDVQSFGHRSWFLIGLLASAVTALGGCAIYRPKPLPWQSNLAPAPTVIVAARDFAIPGLRPAPIDPAKGFTESNVATLAVLGNPGLRAVRRRDHIARAQVFAAGLLPDPVLTGGISKSPFFTGYTAALTEALRALITHAASTAAARAQARRVHLNVVWQEWQVAARARELYVQARTLRRLRTVLGARRRTLERLYRRDLAALAYHEVSSARVSRDLTAWNAAEAAWRALELRENTNRHALDGLLGLEPSVHLRLRRAAREPAITAARYRSALAQLPRRRPDLLALRAGYRSQEQRLRVAILGQFPLIGVGVEKARSAEEGIQSTGFNVSLSLPVFNRNRGSIAIARATRAYLYRRYQARLDESIVQADEVWTATQIMRRQLVVLAAQRAATARAAAMAKRSLSSGTESLAAYARLESAAIGVDVQFIELRGALRQAGVVLGTILAWPIGAHARAVSRASRDHDFEVFARNDQGPVLRHVELLEECVDVRLEARPRVRVERSECLHHRSISGAEELDPVSVRPVTEHELRDGRLDHRIGPEQPIEVGFRAPEQRRFHTRCRRDVPTEDLEELSDESAGRPIGQSDRAAPAADPQEFPCRLFLVRREHHTERGEHDVEALGREGQALRIRRLKRDRQSFGRRTPCGVLQQRFDEVGRHHVRETTSGCEGGVPAACRDVEHPLIRA